MFIDLNCFLRWAMWPMGLLLKFLLAIISLVWVHFSKLTLNSSISVWITNILICGNLAYLTRSLAHFCLTIFVKSHQNSHWCYFFDLKKCQFLCDLSSTKWTRHSFCNKKEYSLTYFLISLTCLPDEVHVPAPSLIGSDRLYAFCLFKKTKMT